MKSVSTFAWMMAIIFSADALATDEIICDSKTFRASFAVGSDGYVAIMILEDKSGSFFSKVLEITNMPKENRQVLIPERAVDVKAFLKRKNASKVVVSVKNGAGYIKFNSHKEEMICDWDI